MDDVLKVIHGGFLAQAKGLPINMRRDDPIHYGPIHMDGGLGLISVGDRRSYTASEESIAQAIMEVIEVGQ